ncbi:MAG: glycosyltransferase family 2 protein, partial [Eubacteriales bacterium]|nr:glycosyltransferase family 2 protein [Eubacteriales bacterium]
MGEDKQISVVIPVFNTEPYLERCVASLDRQTCREIEILLVDDGSSESCARLCDRLAEASEKIRVFHKTNGGVSSARNMGIEYASGKYILFVDSDDWVEEDYCERFLRAQEAFGADCFIWCGFQPFTEKENGRRVVCSNREYDVRRRSDMIELFKLWLLNSPFNKLYSRKLLLESGVRMRPDLSLGEDLVFNLDYLDALGDKRI